MSTINKGKTVKISKLQPGELVLMEFAFYNVTSIRGFTSMLTVVCAKNIILWVLPNAPKRLSHHPLHPDKTDECHPCKHVRVDEDSAL